MSVILVVDDDPDSRTLLDMALTADGHQVVTANNGLEGLRAAREHHPAVILLDLAMPVLDGFGFRAAQINDAGLSAIPVLCVSGRHDALDAARQMGVHGCIPKPFDLESIIAGVRDLAKP